MCSLFPVRFPWIALHADGYLSMLVVFMVAINRRFPKPRPLQDFPQIAILFGATITIISMPHNCCVPLCRKKGYRTVTIDGKQAKVTFHNFPSEKNRLKKSYGSVLSEETSASISNLGSGQRFARYTLKRQIFITSGVAIGLSERILYQLFSISIDLRGDHGPGSLVDHDLVYQAQVETKTD